MNRTYLAALLLALFALRGFALEMMPVAPAGTDNHLKVRTTAYTATEWNGGGYRSAIGTRLRHSGPTYSAASDWSWLPLGTRFRMQETGRTYIIEDYGSALVGRKTVDLYMANDRAMQKWGVRNVSIEIIEWGSWEKSLAVLKPRQRSKHVRRMVISLRQRQANPVLLADLRAKTGNTPD